jgi:hypothetical protein
MSDAATAPPRAARTLQTVAILDLLLTLPFALPVVCGLVVTALLALNVALGLAAAPPLDTLGLLFLNLMGVLAVCWNGARAVSGSVELARIDVPARLVVSLVIVGYVAFAGVPPVLLAFVVTELAGAVVQARALRRA